MVRPTLFLHEEALLLALGDTQGTPAFGTWYQPAIGACVLAELLLAGRIRLDREGRRARVDLLDARPLGDPVVDECLERIGDSGKRRSPQDWVSKLSGLRRLKERIATGLCRRGVLRLEEKKVLGIFTRKLYPELDPAAEEELRARLSRAVLSDERDVDARTAVLISVANRTELLGTVLPKKELRARKQRIEAIVRGDAISETVGEAAHDAVQALQAAIFVAAIVPAVIS